MMKLLFATILLIANPFLESPNGHPPDRRVDAKPTAKADATFSVLTFSDGTKVSPLPDFVDESSSEPSSESSKQHGLKSVLTKIQQSDFEPVTFAGSQDDPIECKCSLREAIATANQNNVEYIIFSNGDPTRLMPQGVSFIVVNEPHDCWDPTEPPNCPILVNTAPLPNPTNEAIFQSFITNGPLPEIEGTMNILGAPIPEKPQAHIIGQVIQLDPSQQINGLVLHGDDSVVAGLIITGFQDNGLVIKPPVGSTLPVKRPRIYNNFIGAYQAYDFFEKALPAPDDDWELGPNGGNGMYLEVSDGILGTVQDRVDPITYHEPNVVSGNLENGIVLASGENNRFEANYIGVGHPYDKNGSRETPLRTSAHKPLGNAENGLLVLPAAGKQVIKLPQDFSLCAMPLTPDPLYITCGPSVFSANGGDGIRFEGGGSESEIGFNMIGTDVTGEYANPQYNPVPDGFDYGNRVHGIHFLRDEGKTVDHVDIFENTISGNGNQGIRLMDSSENAIYANSIGTSHSAKIVNELFEGVRLPNKFGIYLGSGSYNNLIGVDPVDPEQGTENFICHNNQMGIYITGDGPVGEADRNLIIGNRIEVNQRDGIFVGSRRSNVLIGFSDEEDFNPLSLVEFGNVIRKNRFYGIRLTGQTHSNRVGGNTVDQHLDGIYITANRNLIGSDLDGQLDSEETNTIKDNRRYGIHLIPITGQSPPAKNVIAGNVIHDNEDIGVVFRDSLRNLLLQNSLYNHGDMGILFRTGSEENLVFNNQIGDDSTSNSTYGIRILDSDKNTIGRPNSDLVLPTFDQLTHLQFDDSFTYRNNVTRTDSHSIWMRRSSENVVADNNLNGYGGDGIHIENGCFDNQIGGVLEVEAEWLQANDIGSDVATSMNGIAFEFLPEFASEGFSNNNFFLANRFGATPGFLAIDLDDTNLPGVMMPNDNGDADDGNNRLQNTVVITSADPIAQNKILVQFSFATFEDGQYRIEFYHASGASLANSNKSFSKQSMVVTKDANTTTGQIELNDGTFNHVTATATKIVNGKFTDTSEFTLPFAVDRSGPGQD